VISHGLRLDGSRFWVIHRRRVYGPFDYEWSRDFCGVEFQYQGQKFGEYCSVEEICADLKPFHLPHNVFEVASIAIGTILSGILNGDPAANREIRLITKLTELGYCRYAQIESVAG